MNMNMNMNRAFLIILISIAAGWWLPAIAAGAEQTKDVPNRSGPTDNAKSNAAARKLDLNHATKAELAALPGIGPAVADAIIAARPIRQVSDLKNIEGIEEGNLAPLHRLVAVGPPQGRAGASQTTRATAARRVVLGRKININTASAEQLQLLPGIGAARARTIIQKRPYKSVEELMQLKGIKQSTFEKIKDHVTVQ